MRRTPAVLIAIALLVAACSDDAGSESSSPSADATTTTLDPGAAAKAYTEPGPYPVGVTTLDLDAGNSVEVWYPAVEGTTGTVTYDVRDFTPPVIKGLLTGDVPASYSIEAGRDADVADEAFPVVLFSHGFVGIRLQSSFLTAQHASWGMVVVAPDHPSRDLFHALEGTATGDRDEATGELLASLELITAATTTPGSPFEGRIDPDRVATLGHSAGGGTALAAASDERVDGYVSMAAGGPEDGSEYPDRPSFFMGGAEDAIAPPAETSRPAFEAAPAPSLYWEIDSVGHNGFDDFCTFGGGTGIIGIAEQSGLGAFLDTQPEFRQLGEDGCVPPAVPVEETFPIIQHGVTAWLRSLFGEDPEPVGLTGAVETAYDVDITVDSH